MKNFILFILIFLSYLIAFGQIQMPAELHYTCQTCTNSSSSNSNQSGSNCLHASPLWSDNNLWIPGQNFEDKFVRVNMIFLHKNNGSGNFIEGDPEHDQLLNDVFSRINLIYGNLDNSNEPGCYIPNGFLSTTKIKIVPNIIHINDEYGWNNEQDPWPYCPDYPWYLDYLDNQIANNPEIPKGINVYFTETGWYYEDLVVNQTTQQPGPINNACSQFPSTGDLHRSSRVHIPNLFTKYWWMKHYATGIYNEPWDPVVRSWFVGSASSLIAHELGHSFWLPHIYSCSYNLMAPIGEFENSLSPDQIGNMNRCLSITNVRRFTTTESFISTPYTINTNTLWDLDFTMYQDIVVESGFTLTITCKLVMKKNGKIIIKPGGKLIVNDGIITIEDNSHWQGIQVWGNKNANQLRDANGNYQQGYLELNNATIENALCAVDLWKPGDYLKTGGILKATNSTFRNNTRSIHANHYKNINPNNGSEMAYFGRVNNCVFEITNAYIPDQTFYKHVDLADIKGFSFNGSDFTLAPNVTGVSEWNQAIAAYSAGFSVQATCASPTQPCSTYDKCKFSGFRYGIYASHEGFSINTFTVNRAEFENNIYGVSVLGIKNESILNSDFKVGYNITAGCPSVSGYGIYLNNSTGFAIEDNTFTKMPNAPVANYTGIHVINSEGVDDIYKNSFSNLSFGNSAFMKNYDQYANFGLEYLCNTNQGNWADFYVPLDLSMGNGIQSFQGSILTSSGNTFSQTDNRWHFYNGGGYGITYYYNGNSPYNPDPNNDNYELFNVSKSISNTANQCLSHYGGNGSIGSILLNAQDKLLRENQYAYNLVNYNNVKTLHDQLRDGGSTQERLSDIATAQPQDMWALRAELLGVSPHLSEEVLRKVAAKTDVFTESVIFDILAANPDELKKEELLQYLENKENPLPAYMIDILRQVAAGETYRTVLEKQMSMYRKEMTRAANDMIRSYLNDTVTDYNALRGWLDNLGGIEADKQIIATYVQEGNYPQASALANMLPSLYNLTSEALTEHERYMTMLYLYLTLQSENRHLDQLTTNEKALLEDYANNSSGSSGVAAKGILATYYNAQFVDCMQSIEPASLKKGTVSTEDMAKVYGMEISVKPNPASDWAAFDYILPDWDVTATLQITDMTGKIIETFTLTGKQGQKLWDTRPIKAGVYLYTMKAGIKSLSSKITIIK